jgi:hypothetical protein
MAKTTMSPDDRRLYCRVEHALLKLNLSEGCQMEIEAHQGIIDLSARLVTVSEVDVVAAAVMSVPGVRQIRCHASVATPIFIVENGWRTEGDGP